MDLFPKHLRNTLHSVGRLDQYSRGAILLTNKGKLTLKLTHPRFSHIKKYKVLIKGLISETLIEEWRNGVLLDDKYTMPADVNLIYHFKNKNQSLIKVALKEGRNRQIRRIGDKIGHQIIDIQRVAIANIHLNNLKEGDWRHLERREWEHLLL